MENHNFIMNAIEWMCFTEAEFHFRFLFFIFKAERDRSSMYYFAPHMLAVAVAGSGQSWEPGNNSG